MEMANVGLLSTNHSFSFKVKYSVFLSITVTEVNDVLPLQIAP